MPAASRVWTFRTRVLSYLVAFVALLTVALSGILIHAQRRSLRAHFEEGGRTLTHVFADSIRLDVFAGDPQGLLRAATVLLKDPSIVGVVVLDSAGRVLMEAGAPLPSAVSGEAPGIPAPVRDRPSEVVLVEGPDRITFWRAVFDRLVFESAEELYFGEPGGAGPSPAVLGYVAVSVSTKRLRAGIRSVIARSLAAGAGFLGLGVLLSFLVARDASRPLERLVSAFRERGIAVEAQDEIGTLRDTFSGLVERLERAFLTIQELNETLERRVAERTRELALANEELRKARDHLEERVRERTAQLEAAHRQLLQAEKLSAVGKLAASLAHEINNPVFGIRNVLQELRKHPDLSPDEVELVDMSIGECNRIAKLIRSLREFQRPTDGKPGLVDVHASIETMLALCRKRFAKQRIRVEKAFAEHLPPILAVEDQFKQVLLNLLTNAAESLPEGGGTIRVSTSSSDGCVRVRVEDTGCGIPEEHLDRIFEPFFTTKGAVSGTGLGLWVCYGIVERHGGRIHVTSRVGEGTAFTVDWPVGKEGTHGGEGAAGGRRGDSRGHAGPGSDFRRTGCGHGPLGGRGPGAPPTEAV